MAILSSKQVAVRPFRLDTQASLNQIAAAMAQDVYDPTNGNSSGWGSTHDTDAFLGVQPNTEFDVEAPEQHFHDFRDPEILPARFYWWTPNHAALRRQGEQASRRTTHVLTAADVILFPKSNGSIIGLVTARDQQQYMQVVNGLSILLDTVGSGTTVVTENLTEHITEDLFVWLLYRLQWRQDLPPNLYLSAIQEISSVDRQYRGARFQDEASVERIELAALVAVRVKGFGPAKIDLLAVNPDASFSLELHMDGGFQPYRRSTYERSDLDGAPQARALIEDLWTIIIPQLRAAYRADDEWFESGRLRLRLEARNRVYELLGNAPDSNDPEPIFSI